MPYWLPVSVRRPEAPRFESDSADCICFLCSAGAETGVLGENWRQTTCFFYDFISPQLSTAEVLIVDYFLSSDNNERNSLLITTFISVRYHKGSRKPIQTFVFMLLMSPSNFELLCWNHRSCWMNGNRIQRNLITLITVNSIIIRVIIKNMVIPFQEIYNIPLLFVQFINVYFRKLSARSCVHWLQ